MVEVSARYDDVCLGSGLSDATDAEKDAALLQVTTVSVRGLERELQHLDLVRASALTVLRFVHVQLGGAGLPCSVVLQAPSKMTAPVFLYYELNNFYQNHRRYAIV